MRLGEARDRPRLQTLYETALRDPLAGPFLLQRYGGASELLWGGEPGHGSIVAAQQDELPGWIAWRHDETVVVIGPFVVDERFRRLGIGTRLAAAALATLRDLGLRVVQADHLACDAASARVFAKQCLRPVGELRGPAGERIVRRERVFQRPRQERRMGDILTHRGEA